MAIATGPYIRSTLWRYLHRRCGAKASLRRRQASFPQVRRRCPAGRAVTLTTHRQYKRPSHAELWIVHGIGHAWTGGSSKGSFTDESGPDASREMLRFFLSQSLTCERHHDNA